MARVAPHLIDGTPGAKFREALDGAMGFTRPPHTPSDEWPEDCLVQWGGSGVVFSPTGSYRTAFFEAFPEDTFLRGEGKDIPAAEEAALQQWRRISACAGHEYEARGYRNGAGFCQHCGMFKAHVFTWPCRDCGQPTDYHPIPNSEAHLCKSCFEKTPEGAERVSAWEQLFGDA